jgi:hypothetical protein
MSGRRAITRTITTLLLAASMLIGVIPAFAAEPGFEAGRGRGLLEDPNVGKYFALYREGTNDYYGWATHGTGGGFVQTKPYVPSSGGGDVIIEFNQEQSQEISIEFCDEGGVRLGYIITRRFLGQWGDLLDGVAGEDSDVDTSVAGTAAQRPMTH